MFIEQTIGYIKHDVIDLLETRIKTTESERNSVSPPFWDA